ncbi:NADPH-dependent FMN reductase [Aquimarina muelleri]|uniref:NAD(P)H dehydrogenase (Quinone) n=1 Tax=Aquimarina muelleri TaxID=279356 RepID=A0A918JVE5_9FLAO|nr:NADPH-dependent FMN reductase [Aquimarina muelleri]MCX2762461.1 NAD(P)H-dependent oxidoreductase [Aquimarina muelleri]GGX20683.1 NAD(P)H dehydrogenase (quinone) [Aquimarina muelleri]
MDKKLNVLGINGSASQNSSNLAILKIIAEKGASNFNWTFLDDLTELPHFKTELTSENTPEKIIEFRNQIENADGILICTPEYVFSIPSGLKNAIEWCVSTTVFSDKAIGLITASASGEKAHLELKLIMKTIQANFTNDTTLLIQGVKGKVSKEGEIVDAKTEMELERFMQSFNERVRESNKQTSLNSSF